MRNQPALRIDNIRMPPLAHLDLRDHVPDQLQIDLGDAYTGVTSCSCNSERHVGLGFAAEIYRAIIHLSRRRFCELGILRKVGTARHHIHGQTRYAQPLLATGIELSQLGDGWHLA